MIAQRILAVLVVFVAGITQVNAQSLALASDGALGWSPVVGAPFALPARAQALHVLLAGDTYDKQIGLGVREDLARMTAALQRTAPDGVRINFTVIHGAMANRQNILNTIAGIQAARTDAILFYWSGHGAYNDAGHFLVLPSGEALYRTEVINAIQSKQPRLAVVITDSCHDWSNATISLPHTTRYRPTDTGTVSSTSALFTELFLKPTGLLDINGASAGESAVIGNNGSLFTFVLCRNLELHATERLPWREFLALVDPNVREGFALINPNGVHSEQAEKVYDRQSVKIWSLPWDERGLRLGLSVAENWGDGVRVVQVWPRYPASSLRNGQGPVAYALQPYDVILAVNGQYIRSTREFTSAVTTSPQIMQLSVRDIRTGYIRQFEATLRY
jgi:hypothetical protein